MKKTAVCISIFMFIGILCLASFSRGTEGYPDFDVLGADKTITDKTNDLYKYSESGYESTGTQVDWIDLVNATFEEGTENYTITLLLNGDYNNATIEMFIEINGTVRTEYDSYSSYDDIWIKLYKSSGTIENYVHSASALLDSPYQEWDIATISGKMITFTFPKENISNAIININPISEWRVLIYAEGDLGDTTYYDFMPNYSLPSLPGIPGFPLLMLGLTSLVSILLILRKVRKS